MFWVGEDTNVGLGDGLDGGGGSRHCDCRSMHDGRRERKRKSIEEDDKSEQVNCGRSSYPTVEGLEGYGIPRETVLIELLAHQSKKQQSNAMYAWKRSCGSSPQRPASGESGQSKGEEIV